MRTTLELKHKQSNCDTQLLIKVKDVPKRKGPGSLVSKVLRDLAIRVQTPIRAKTL